MDRYDWGTKWAGSVWEGMGGGEGRFPLETVCTNGSYAEKHHPMNDFT